MRLLVLGAGGIGGYFGARIHAAGGDVTFLVRPARAAALRENGLRITSYNVCYTKLLRRSNCRKPCNSSGHKPHEFCRITSYNVCYTKLLR